MVLLVARLSDFGLDRGELGCSRSHWVMCSPITSRSCTSVVEKTFTAEN